MAEFDGTNWLRCFVAVAYKSHVLTVAWDHRPELVAFACSYQRPG